MVQPFIKLDQFLKWQQVASTGGTAKWLIQSGEVQVNGAVETRRGRKLVAGDVVVVGDRTYGVSLEDLGSVYNSRQTP
ncbi:MAG: RNA-binding S4 domain-containing protein [Cyanobacteria bacterium]|nr:RNA-binding S4 domain-containing protein [Cyanobacteriota bacterium]